MPSGPRLRIPDDPALRAAIAELFGHCSLSCAALWAIACARHILPLSLAGEKETELTENGMRTAENRIKGIASVYELRQSALEIHAAARQCSSGITGTALRAAGHAVSTGHMKEHAMVCSDYAIKFIHLSFPGSADKIREERQWQLDELKKLRGNY